MESKKQLILMVLNELSVNTDAQHPLPQTQIAKNLSGEKYTCDRKTVCRNIKFLIEMGYPIKKTPKGFYMEYKAFSVNEAAFVKAAILAAEGKSEAEKQAIAEKVGDALASRIRR